MGELSAPNFRNQPWCIYEGPELEEIAINTAVIHNLPKFSGRQGESATSHLLRFHGICHNLKPYRVELEDFKLKAFYFSLIDAANDWFLSLPSGSIQTWDQMQRKFLNKYYPAGRAMQVRRQLQDLRQGSNETMYEYVEKFNTLEQSCCNLELPEKLIVEYMLNGLRKLDRKLLAASAGGTLMRLTPAGVRRKIVEVAENARFQDESNNKEEFSRTKNVSQVEPPSSSMAKEIKQLKEMMQQVIRRQPVQVKPCEFCGATDHKTDACPSLQEDTHANVNAVGEFQSYNNRAPQQAQQQQYYRPPYRQQQGSYNNQNQYQQRAHHQNQSGPSQQSEPLEDIVRELAASVHQYLVKTNGTLAELSKQMFNLVQNVSELKGDSGRLPSQTVPNPRGNINTLAVVDESDAEKAEKEAKTVRIAPTIDISATLMSKENAP
ncbi:unnamed protein product [Rhodiola kirilowii]